MLYCTHWSLTAAENKNKNTSSMGSKTHQTPSDTSFVIWYAGFEHRDLAILCLLMLKIIRVSYSYQSIQTVGLLCLRQIPVAFLCGKRLNFFRTLLAGFIQSFPFGCLPCDTSHVTGARKEHQSLWTRHPAANQQRSKLTCTHPHGGVWERARISSQAVRNLKCCYETCQVFKGNF